MVSGHVLPSACGFSVACLLGRLPTGLARPRSKGCEAAIREAGTQSLMVLWPAPSRRWLLDVLLLLQIANCKATRVGVEGWSYVPPDGHRPR